jgi:hypothetical protein
LYYKDMQREPETVEINPQDRRQDFRHAFQRPCRVTPATNPQDEVGGITTDVSRSGMSVRIPAAACAPNVPAQGDFARVVIDLPSSGKFSPRSLECTTRVVRIAKDENGEQHVAFEVLNMKVTILRTKRASRPKDPEILVQ